MPVGPHPLPWPVDPRLDPVLLAQGDTRNVVDRYRYWTVDAIAADLATRRSTLQVAIENLEHDANIGSIVRTANAFNVSAVHIVGRRRWNRRGAMMTEKYLEVIMHPTFAQFQEWRRAKALDLIAVDMIPGAEPLESAILPRDAVFLFGQEGPGCSPAAIAHADKVVCITQYGSTRSINVAAAAAIAMHAWVRQHRPVPSCTTPDQG